jgi:outer membrane protein insertion porin family
MERYRYHDYDDDFEEQNRRRTTYSYRWTSVDTVITTDPTPDTSVVVRRNSQDDVVLGDALPGSVVAYEREWNRATRVSFTVTRDSHNLPEFATDGSIFSYSFEHTGGILGGFWKYQRHQVSFARFFPLIGNIALATKIQYGTILAGSDDPYDRRILISDRFNPGGTAYDGTVRGYDDGSLTPDSTVAGSVSQYYYYADPDSVNVNVDEPDSISTSSSFTTRVRGKYMLVANAEIQIPLVKQQIYGLLFFDAGNSWLHLDDIKPITGLYKGIGVGFRVLVPGIGTLGFDFAKPLDDPPDGDDRSWKPHFQIGTTIR